MSNNIQLPFSGFVTIEDFDQNKTDIDIGKMKLFDSYSDSVEMGERIIYMKELTELSGEPILKIDFIMNYGGGYRFMGAYIESEHNGVDSDLYNVKSYIS